MLHGSPTMAISWPAFFCNNQEWSLNVTCCSGRLLAVQEGYMDVQGYMRKKIMMKIVTTNDVAGLLPDQQPIATSPLKYAK